MIKIVELLSPARDFAALNAAIANGADSVYLGISGFNLRAHVSGFQIEDLKEAVKRCHDSNVKLYVCTNTIMKDKDIESLKKAMPGIKSAGADAVIVSDLGALQAARENDMKVHMSVQANISNQESLKLLKELGVSRVILSRELSLDEIRNLKEKSPVEVEVFVHGAMCLAISGRCFLSSYLYGKSANCGECLQPCRKNWKLVSDDFEEFEIAEFGIQEFKSSQNETESYHGTEGHNEIESYHGTEGHNEIESYHGTEGHNATESHNETEGNILTESHILSPKDLCMIEHIPKLIEAGIDSFKIEGRARPADYVTTVTRTYRDAIDRYEAGDWKIDETYEKWVEELRKVFNRGFDTGFYFQTPYKTSKSNVSTHIKKDIGLVCNYYKNVSAAEIRLWDDLKVGDEIIIEGRKTGSLVQYVNSMQIDGKDVNEVRKGHNVGIFVEGRVRPNDVVYKRKIRKSG